MPACIARDKAAVAGALEGRACSMSRRWPGSCGGNAPVAGEQAAVRGGQAAAVLAATPRRVLRERYRVEQDARGHQPAQAHRPTARVSQGVERRAPATLHKSREVY